MGQLSTEAKILSPFVTLVIFVSLNEVASAIKSGVERSQTLGYNWIKSANEFPMG